MYYIICQDGPLEPVLSILKGKTNVKFLLSNLPETIEFGDLKVIRFLCFENIYCSHKKYLTCSKTSYKGIPTINQKQLNFSGIILLFYPFIGKNPRPSGRPLFYVTLRISTQQFHQPSTGIEAIRSQVPSKATNWTRKCKEDHVFAVVETAFALTSHLLT
jgi:hypothetical protein